MKLISLVMGRADLECKFTSFLKNGGIRFRTGPVIPFLSKVISLLTGEIKYMVELDSSSTL